MDKERIPAPERDDVREPEDVDAAASTAPTPDPNDEIPVPIAMYPSEIDERAQVVEALREEGNSNRADELGLQP
jgi:hypothetical protein